MFAHPYWVIGVNICFLVAFACGKLIGSGFSGSRPSVAGYTNGGISGREREGKDEWYGVKKDGGWMCIEPVGALKHV
ncbi:hypothetical protein HOY82DRAFT_573318, partial [Tuber indicum]